MNDAERDTYIKDTHDTVLVLVERMDNHICDKQKHTIPPCKQIEDIDKSVKKLDDRNWKMVVLALLSSISGIGALVLFILTKWT